MQKKKCVRCGLVKDIDDFHKRKTGNSYSSYCKSCLSTYYKDYHTRNPTATRKVWLLRLFPTITDEQILHIFSLCRGVCDICGRRLIGSSKHLDHKGLILRGWVCGSCNRGLGLFGDDPDRLRKAADYVENAKIFSSEDCSV